MSSPQSLQQYLARVAPVRIREGVLLGAALLLSVVSEGAENLTEAALAPRSGPRGSTMFSVVSPAQSGIVTENRYADPEMWGKHYQEFALGSIGTGVAIGDYDGDGRPDVFVTSKTEGCRLFRNLGNWKFEDVTEKAGLRETAGALEQGLVWMKRSTGGANETAGTIEPWQQGATFVDVNNDGLLDIYVCRFGVPNLLYVNQGNGTFKEEAAKRGLAVSDASGMAAFCDYDRDGWLDVYVQTNMLDGAAHPAGQRGYLFHNNRDGTFTNVTEHAGIAGESLSHSATWWDYDNDGWPDLYVANDFAAPDRLYHNNHDGTFSDTINQVVPHMPYSAMGADLGDINNDGRIDFFVSEMAATTHEKDQRGMADSHELSHEDNESTKVSQQYMRNALYLNTGTGYCQEVASLAGLAATDWTWSVRFEDLDNDGRLDLHVTNGMNREHHNTDLRQRILTADNLADRMRLMRASPVMAENHFVFRNRGDLQFDDVSAAWGLNQKGVSFGAAFADLDGDGDLDLIYSNYEKGVTVLRNDSDAGHSIIVALRGTQSNRFGVGAIVRIETAAGVQVRPLVLARGYLSSSEPVLHFGLGEETRIKRLTVEWPSGQSQNFTDLAADRKFTITEPAAPLVPPTTPAPPPLTQFTEMSQPAGLALTAREGSLQEARPQPLLTTRFNHRGPGLAVGDINGDGRDDVILGGTTQDLARLLISGAGSEFTSQDVAPPSSRVLLDDGPMLVFDANADGFNDVLITKAGTNLPYGAPQYQPRLLLNDGHGALQAAPAEALPPLALSAGAVATADFDRDGRLDLFIGARVVPGKYPLAPRSALLANRGDRFEDVTDAVAPGLREVGLVTSALWSDVDGDGWLDLLLTLEWGGVRYFHNNAGHGFEDWSVTAGFSTAGTGWWISIATADFNGDGRPDYVVGNVGLNTQYHASPERPALLYYGAFTEGGSPLMVEAYYEGERLFPWRTRKELGAKIPAILKRYPKNDFYARATLGEILGEDRLAAARRFVATEFRSGVFLSKTDGSYRFDPLPRIAQIAPVQGLVTGDFDGDGNADIYAVQNSYAPTPVIGHFDGGISQLLRGDGHGHFTPVPPAESNLIVTGDAKALAVLDLDGDGWPDFLVTRNSDTMLAFHNNGIVGRHSLHVALHGRAGNPTAVGARLTLELTDGSREIGEVTAGSGYYTQSTAGCFFGYLDANPPRRLSIRWPDGASTVHEVPPRSSTLNFPQQ